MQSFSQLKEKNLMLGNKPMKVENVLPQKRKHFIFVKRDLKEAMIPNPIRRLDLIKHLLNSQLK